MNGVAKAAGLCFLDDGVDWARDSAVSLMSRSGRETLSEQVLKVSVCVQVSEGSTG